MTEATRFEPVMNVIRTVARSLVGADGVTFILRDNDECVYVEEDAVGPLWKGQRFPVSVCVSGWAMRNGTPAIIEDIFDDPRVPVEAYRHTFVRSMVMVPISINGGKPIGAIGAYWAVRHRATPNQIDTLLALADSALLQVDAK